jgi:hypothetical protein
MWQKNSPTGIANTSGLFVAKVSKARNAVAINLKDSCPEVLVSM